MFKTDSIFRLLTSSFKRYTIRPPKSSLGRPSRPDSPVERKISSRGHTIAAIIDRGDLLLCPVANMFVPLLPPSLSSSASLLPLKEVLFRATQKRNGLPVSWHDLATLIPFSLFSPREHREPSCAAAQSEAAHISVQVPPTAVEDYRFLSLGPLAHRRSLLPAKLTMCVHQTGKKLCRRRNGSLLSSVCVKHLFT